MWRASTSSTRSSWALAARRLGHRQVGDGRRIERPGIAADAHPSRLQRDRPGRARRQMCRSRCAAATTMSDMDQPTPHAATTRRIVDLSHPIHDGMVTYPGIPAPSVGTHLSFDDAAAMYAPGTEFTIGMITLSSNTGTYLDTPAHRYRGGDDLRRGPDRAAGRPRGRRGPRRRPAGGRGGSRGGRRRPGAARRRGPGRARRDRPRPTLGHRRLLPRPPVPDRGGGRLAGRTGRGARRHRQPEHRRHPHGRAAGAHPPARRRHPGGRAPHRPRPAACDRFPVLGAARRRWRGWARSPCGPSPSWTVLSEASPAGPVLTRRSRTIGPERPSDPLAL